MEFRKYDHMDLSPEELESICIPRHQRIADSFEPNEPEEPQEHEDLDDMDFMG